MTPLLLIHGYNHDPASEKHSPFRKGGNFDIWPKIFPDSECIFVPWYSAVQGRDILKAFSNGCWNTYQYAYTKLVPPAVDKAAELLPDKADIMAHSLGTRVALQLVDRHPDRIRRVLLLNGAETVNEALPIMERYPDIPFMNVAVKTDDVVSKMGAWFEPKLGKHHCIGNGIGPLPANVRQVVLDDGILRDFYKRNHGWNLRGDNPDSAGDHSYSFLWQGNWPLYRAFIDGEI